MYVSRTDQLVSGGSSLGKTNSPLHPGIWSGLVLKDLVNDITVALSPLADCCGSIRRILDCFINSHITSDHMACSFSHYSDFGIWAKEGSTYYSSLYFLYLSLTMCICAHACMYMSMWMFLPREVRVAIISRVRTQWAEVLYSTVNHVFSKMFRRHSLLLQLTDKL